MMTGLHPVGGAAAAGVDEISRAPNRRAVKISKCRKVKSSEKIPVYVRI